MLETDHPHLTAKFVAAKPLLTQAQKGRNRVIHGQWANHPEQGIVKLRSSARGKLKFSFEPITVGEIEAISLDVGNAGLAVLKMVVNK